MEDGRSMPCPGCFTPTSKETQYPLYRTLGGPKGQSAETQKNLVPTGIWSPYCPAHGKSLNWLCYPGPGQTHSTGTIFTYFLPILISSWFFIFSLPDYSYVPFSHCCELSHLLLPTASRHTAFKYAWNHGSGRTVQKCQTLAIAVAVQQTLRSSMAVNIYTSDFPCSFIYIFWLGFMHKAHNP